MPGPWGGNSNEGTGHCREAGPDPRGAEMAVSPEYHRNVGKGLDTTPSLSRGKVLAEHSACGLLILLKPHRKMV